MEDAQRRGLSFRRTKKSLCSYEVFFKSECTHTFSGPTESVLRSFQFEVELNMDEKPRPGRELKKVRVDMKHVNSIDFG